MPWIPMRFKGATDVLARCDETGAPVVTGGRVDIRYNRGDGRVYRAGTANLAAVAGAAPFDDPAADAADSPAPAAKTTRTPAAKATSTRTPTRIASIPGKNDPLPPLAAPGSAALSPGPIVAPEGPNVIAYADGACTGNPGPAGLGITLLDELRCFERSEYLGHGTNNIAELTAILRVLQAVPPARAHEVRTDSQYSIGVLSKGWKAKANQELIATIKTLMRGRNVRLTYVPGHSGVAGNERADSLARGSIERRGSTGWFAR